MEQRIIDKGIVPLRPRDCRQQEQPVQTLQRTGSSGQGPLLSQRVKLHQSQSRFFSWEVLLQAAAKVAGAAPPKPKAPSRKVLSLHSGRSRDGEGEIAYALVDSGATHPLRRANGAGEWQAASPVVVHLAGGEVVELRMNSARTFWVPCSGMTRTTSTAPIVWEPWSTCS